MSDTLEEMRESLFKENGCYISDDEVIETYNALLVKEPDLRPLHYKAGKDTFAWAEDKYNIETCIAIASFNIHKYNDRNKGQDYEDFGKIADYARWARELIDKEKEK